MKKAMLNEYALNGYTVISNLPIGAPMAWLSDVLPVGFLAFDGSEYNQTDFPELYNVVKNIPAFHSETEGKFKIPNLKGRVLQGADTVIGELIEAGLPNITGYLKNVSMDVNDKGAGGVFDKEQSSGSHGSTGREFQNVTFSASRSNPIYKDDCDTVQSPAFTVRWIIKATQYASLEQNAIDDTRTTNTNVHSALKTQADIANAKKWNYLGQDTVQLPTEWNEIIIQIYNNDYSVVVGEIHILNLSYTNNTTFTTACGGSAAYERSLWELNVSNNSISNIGGVFSKGKSYYR